MLGKVVPLSRSLSWRSICVAGFICGLFLVVNAQSERTFRGSLGDNHIEMRLNFNGTQVSGSYSYDQFRKELQLTGTVTGEGKWELIETSAGKKTGKFLCPPGKSRFDVELECDWTKPTGKAETKSWLSEQSLALPTGLKLTPKVIIRPRSSTTVSYPQLTGPGAGVSGFNRRIAKLVADSMKDFYPETPSDGAFDLNYTVQSATAEIVSVEINEYMDTGGAHPTTRVWGFTYNLSRNREVKLVDLFKRGAAFEAILKKYCVAEINRHADYLDAEETRLNGKPAAKREEPVMSDDGLPEEGFGDFSIGPRGIIIYFDFPHVMAVFGKVLVPYSELKAQLDPDGPAGRFVNR
jgi:hypothetical protein